MTTILFNSFTFLYFSIIVVLGILIIKNRSWQHLWLLVASYYFYWYSSGWLVVLLLFSAVLDFHCGKAVYTSKNNRKLFLWISLIGNLGLLGVFKYLDFGIQTVNYLSGLLGTSTNIPLMHIILPIGISFYTFQTMSYTLDIYFKKMKPTNSFLKFGLYVAFFPQLVAGPIVRAIDFIPQLKKRLKILPANLQEGLTLILWGLVKKVVFADTIAIFVNAYFADPTQYTNSLILFLATLGFGIQIYCDFSGYSDIAIGVAQIFGLKLRLNFDKPYFATNISQFWRKWHISLSSWLRDYLYIPLGGNRKGKVRTYVNLLITMILGGLWHGAAWNFLAWGAYQGALLAIHKYCAEKRWTKIFDNLGKYKKYVLLIITQYFVFLGWLIFRVKSGEQLIYTMKKFLSFTLVEGLGNALDLITTHRIPIIFMVVFIAIHTFTFYNKDFIEQMGKKDLFTWGLYVLIAILALLFLSPAKTVEFIYFQF